MYGTMTALTFADLGQTLDMAKRDYIRNEHEVYVETNKWMGKRPSKNRIVNHFATVFMIQNIGVWTLPGEYRAGFQTYFIVDHGAAVLGNVRIGLKVNF